MPTAVAGGYDFNRVDAGGGGACAITSLGLAYCWGWNANGTLGDGTTTNRNVPTGVVSLSVQVVTTTVGAIVDASLSFTVAGYNAGTCNGVAISATGSTGTAVTLRPTLIANPVGGQTLTVSSNAGGGYTIFARSSGALSDGNGHTIANWTGTNASPTSFPSAGTAAFGYTTDHNLSGTATRFQPDLWAGFTGSNVEVGYAGSGPINADATHVCMQVGIGSATPAANYTTTVIYTAVPTF